MQQLQSKYCKIEKTSRFLIDISIWTIYIGTALSVNCTSPLLFTKVFQRYTYENIA